MKNVITLFIVLLMLSNINAQTKIVKTLNPQKCPTVNIKVPNNLIEHEAWEEGGVRIDIKIKVNLPEVVLKALLEAGRYELKGQKVETDYLLSAPNMEVPISVEGVAIKELVTIKVTTPEYIVMNTNGTLYKDIDEEAIRGSFRSDTREEIEAVIKRMKEIREDLNVHVSVVSVVENQAIDVNIFRLTVGRDAMTLDQLDFPKVGE